MTIPLIRMPTFSLTGERYGMVYFVELVADNDDVLVYRVRAGKWPKVVMRDSLAHYPPQDTPDLPDYHRWHYGDITTVVYLQEDQSYSERGRIEFYEDASWQLLLTTEKRAVWAVFLKRPPPRFTGLE